MSHCVVGQARLCKLKADGIEPVLVARNKLLWFDFHNKAFSCSQGEQVVRYVGTGLPIQHVVLLERLCLDAAHDRAGYGQLQKRFFGFGLVFQKSVALQPRGSNSPHRTRWGAADDLACGAHALSPVSRQRFPTPPCDEGRWLLTGGALSAILVVSRRQQRLKAPTVRKVVGVFLCHIDFPSYLHVAA